MNHLVQHLVRHLGRPVGRPGAIALLTVLVTGLSGFRLTQQELSTEAQNDPIAPNQMDWTRHEETIMPADLRTADWLAKRLRWVERAAHAQVPASTAVSDLGGTSWRLVQFQGSDDTTQTPDDRDKYTIAFTANGSVRVRFDCNRGRGVWTSSAPNQLRLGMLALTRALCPPGSLHDRLVRDWAAVRSYILHDGHLFLSLLADGGIYEFEPVEPVPLPSASPGRSPGD